MSSRTQPVTITYVAWDNSANAGKAGDANKHALKWVKDGVPATPTNAPVEVDAVAAPGLYALALTAAEATADVGTLAGTSSTAGVVIIPATIAFERLPTAAPGQNGGLPTVGETGLTVDVQTIKGQAVTVPNGGVTLPAVVGTGTSNYAGGPVASVTAPVLINLSQAVPDSKDATVGGSLAGAWAAGWGKVLLDKVGKFLKVWGPGNTSATPSATFALDDATSPSSKTPV